MDERIKDIQSMLSWIESDIKYYESEVNRLNIVIEDMTNERKGLANGLFEKRSECGKLKKEYKALQQKYDALLAKHTELEANCTQFRLKAEKYEKLYRKLVSHKAKNPILETAEKLEADDEPSKENFGKVMNAWFEGIFSDLEQD